MLHGTLPHDTALILEIENSDAIRKGNKEIPESLVECTAFVNTEYIKRGRGDAAPIHLVLYG